MRIIFFIVFFVIFTVRSSLAQLDTLEYHVGVNGVFGSQGFAPHWIVSNRYGVFDDAGNDLMLLPGISARYGLGKHFQLEGGFDALIKYDLDQSLIYQGYINVEFHKLKFIAGRQEFTLGQYSEDLSSGSFLVSNNALPIPRVGIGFYDYVDVPFTEGYL